MALLGRTHLLRQAGKGGEFGARVRGQFRVPVSPQLEAGGSPAATQPQVKLERSAEQAGGDCLRLGRRWRPQWFRGPAPIRAKPNLLPGVGQRPVCLL